MASAAGIIVGTGIMTLANEYVQASGTPDPAHPVASQVNWKVIPATAIAAGLFYGLEQVNEKVAVALAGLVFVTSFLFSQPALTYIPGVQQKDKTSPVGTLMTLVGVTGHLPPNAQSGQTTVFAGIPVS